MLAGIDLSAVQGLVDGARVAASGTRFAIHRCGVGNDAPDEYFDRNIASLKAAGIVVGAYHFCYPLPTLAGHVNREPIAQARLHYAASRGLGSNPGDLPPCVDCEWPGAGDFQKWGVSAASIKAWLSTYLEETEQLYQVTPLLYSFPDYLKLLALDDSFARYPLWAASYEPTPFITPPWVDCAIWQNSGWDERGVRQGGIPGDGGGRLYDGRPVDTDLIADELSLATLIRKPFPSDSD